MSCAPCGRNGLRIQETVPPLHMAEAVGLPGGVMLPPKTVSTKWRVSAFDDGCGSRLPGRPCFQGRRRRHEGVQPASGDNGLRFQPLQTTIVMDLVWPSYGESQVRSVNDCWRLIVALVCNFLSHPGTHYVTVSNASSISIAAIASMSLR